MEEYPLFSVVVVCEFLEIGKELCLVCVHFETLRNWFSWVWGSQVWPKNPVLTEFEIRNCGYILCVTKGLK